MIQGPAHRADLAAAGTSLGQGDGARRQMGDLPARRGPDIVQISRCRARELRGPVPRSYAASPCRSSAWGSMGSLKTRRRIAGPSVLSWIAIAFDGGRRGWRSRYSRSALCQEGGEPNDRSNVPAWKARVRCARRRCCCSCDPLAMRMAAGMKPVSLSRFRAGLSRIMSRLAVPGTGTQSTPAAIAFRPAAVIFTRNTFGRLSPRSLASPA